MAKDKTAETTTAETTTAATTIDEKVQELLIAGDSEGLVNYLVGLGSVGIARLVELQKNLNAAMEAAKANAGPDVRNVADAVGLENHPGLAFVKNVGYKVKSGQHRIVVGFHPSRKHRELGTPILVFPFTGLGKDKAPTKEQQDAMIKLAVTMAITGMGAVEA